MREAKRLPYDVAHMCTTVVGDGDLDIPLFLFAAYYQKSHINKYGV